MSSGTGFNGCYASHIVLRKGTHVKKIPSEISDSLASTINCALATVINCIDSLPDNIRNNGKRAFIQGDGLLGLYSCAILKDIGFTHIYCSGHHSSRSSLVESFGGIPVYGGKLLQNLVIYYWIIFKFFSKINLLIMKVI
jgi:D-arabinose 1-dehydrogenase-like Zn-dependent alcohol dehydrogenase